MWFDPFPLLIAQPKQVPAHDPNPLPKTNQDRIVRAEKLMSSDPSFPSDDSGSIDAGQTEALIERYLCAEIIRQFVARSIKYVRDGASGQYLPSQLTQSQRTHLSPFPYVDSFSENRAITPRLEDELISDRPKVNSLEKLGCASLSPC
jgi:hypothetical protein